MLNQYYSYYPREQWAQFQAQDLALISPQQLSQLVSLEDQLSPLDVQEVYGPLLHYIEADYRYLSAYNQAKQDFFNQQDPLQKQVVKVPFLIGISGSVAVGKSTTARLLHKLLSQTFPQRKVDLITTDGFLYPNEVLEQKGLLKRKGFPESYDMPLLLEFVAHVKTKASPFPIPLYSHDRYNIVKGEYQVIENPDILIVEGINVFQLPSNQQIYVSDFFDFSIYIDAPTELIYQWFVDRFLVHLQMAKDDPSSYYYQMSQWSKQAAIDYAKEVWTTINLPNLIQHIKPTRSRADLVLHKSDNHYIDSVYVRKY